jgi:predicted MFS family arabinose efflux permease
MGVFFMGIPLGVGLSFLLAGTVGATYGWRSTFALLGVIGVVLALPALMLRANRDGGAAAAERGAPFFQQIRAVIGALRSSPTVMFTITGFVLVHLVFAGLAFTQLWLVRERGFDAAGIARQVGAIGLAFGVLGSLVGGVLSDRLARYIKGGHAGFITLLVILCGPLMLAYRFAEPGSMLFYTGMCAGFFLPLALYGPALALIQGLTPVQMRSTVTGFAMMLINVFAVAIGNAAAGAVSDRLAAAGSAHPLTTVLIATDLIVMAGRSSRWLHAAARATPRGVRGKCGRVTSASTQAAVRAEPPACDCRRRACRTGSSGAT